MRLILNPIFPLPLSLCFGGAHSLKIIIINLSSLNPRSMRGNERIAFFFVESLHSLSESEWCLNGGRDIYGFSMEFYLGFYSFSYLSIKNAILCCTYYQEFIWVKIQNQSCQKKVLNCGASMLLGVRTLPLCDEWPKVKLAVFLRCT